MESWVGASAVLIRLVPVLQVILNMTQFVVGGYQVIVVDVGTLFDSERKKQYIVTQRKSLRVIFNILIFRSLQVKKNKNNEEGLGERERRRKMGTGG